MTLTEEEEKEEGHSFINSYIYVKHCTHVRISSRSMYFRPEFTQETDNISSLTIIAFIQRFKHRQHNTYTTRQEQLKPVIFSSQTFLSNSLFIVTCLRPSSLVCGF